MTRIVLDADWKTKLNGLCDQIELCDSEGRIMGRFLPEELYQGLVYQLAESHRPPLTEDEVQRRRNPSVQKSLDEILAALRKS